MKYFKANGKLLISAEYLVLNGAEALALPLTKMHQCLEVTHSNGPYHTWVAEDEKGLEWLNFKWPMDFKIEEKHSDKISGRILDILKFIQHLNPTLFTNYTKFKTKMNF